MGVFAALKALDEVFVHLVRWTAWCGEVGCSPEVSRKRSGEGVNKRKKSRSLAVMMTASSLLSAE
jgi:hypothetical protein